MVVLSMHDTLTHKHPISVVKTRPHVAGQTRQFLEEYHILVCAGQLLIQLSTYGMS